MGPRTGGRFAPGTQQALDQALENLTEAERNMSDAASHSSQPQAERAADQLSRAQAALSQMRHDQTGSQMSDVQDQARKLADKQSSFDERLRKNFGGGAAGERSDEQNRRLSAQMADVKRKEIDDLHDLEHAMQQAARGMQNTQPDASKKLRDAIGQMQQDELESRMRWTADALSKEMGSYAVMREAPVTMALNQLKDSLRDAAGAMKKGDQGEGDQGLEQALARAQKLRQDLQAMAGQQPGKPGEQLQGQQPGKSGQQQGGQQAGGQQAGGQPTGQPGERSGESMRGGAGPVGPAGSGSWDAMNLGNWQPPDAATVTRSYDESIRELARIQQLSHGQPATEKEIQDLLRTVQRLDPRRFSADPKKLAALEQQLLAEVEEAELVLRRKVEDTNGSVRTPSPMSVPPGYADAVAEYFKRLSH
jgi:hypothetical protein